MNFGWKKEEILKQIKELKTNKNLPLSEKILFNGNYKDMLDNLNNTDTFCFKNNLFENFNVLFSNQNFFNRDYFQSILPYLQKLYDLFINNHFSELKSLPTNNISDNDLLTITHDYFQSFKDDRIKLFNKILKENNNFIQIFNNQEFLTIGLTYYFLYDNPKFYIYINRENNITDIITMVHEFEHIFSFYFYGYDYVYKSAEIPSITSTYYLLDYLEKQNYSQEEIVLSRVLEYYLFLYKLSLVYTQYYQINNYNKFDLLIKLINQLIKGIDIEDYYNINYDKNSIEQLFNSIIPIYIHNNYTKEEGINESYQYLTGLKNINDIAIENTINYVINDIKNNRKLIKK